MINIRKSFFVLLVIFIILSNYSPSEIHAKQKELKFAENSALALNYHRVRSDNFFDKLLYYSSNSKELKSYSISKSKFENQIKWLKAHDAHFLTEKELIKYKESGNFPKKSVWINFDDMDASIYKNAYPILKKHNVPATGFVITNRVGTKNFHNLNLITLDQLNEMKASGFWEFNSHTHDLHSLKKNKSLMVSASNIKLENDIKNSNSYLKKHFSNQNDSIAYPYGQISDENITSLKNAGIKYGYTLEDKAITPNDNNYYIPRILMNDDTFNKLIQNWKGFKDD
ncbi:intercellular adhesin biosynthesis polysaccharide N-deacetylase [Staphylococcus xylosus]|uniref:intercellular adhesin biosynthesis polysaccharide N-deacetylase n=1 Tax=Staphylococcus xylosus TaxID=1288 RepID=UPI000414080E|nr:intercellular adhesin biosynthesis polysaccharide N-deacetylase [Staphylococcus xylosus]AID02618.1 poly-beta-1,6-N-acetyl-D-glucosamine N-deacetylase [Staphylococcus xylosus]ARD75750.1 intercellular adhesin biosynthesis polysaccharide N-deacetylase [Staphylococcus xylosus]MEB6240514.1 intercellular adhesin biosynthesis polysaccharide N-deacetylase [Staphylococcus xylosus]MEB6290378.1 intercellular adhesin biosynthesis polysaccharide N-deacetylase [Staphylococcus xylosus]MEB7660174.1 interce